MWRHLAAVLRGRGPDRLGFWSLGPWHLSRRTVCISGEWWVATTFGYHFQDATETATWLEPSRNLDLP